jgi:hypothetical protein
VSGSDSFWQRLLRAALFKGPPMLLEFREEDIISGYKESQRIAKRFDKLRR